MVQLLDKNLDGDSRDSGELFWQLSDAQFSSVAVIDQNAVLQERVSYTSYGVGTHRWPHEVNNTGGVTTSGSTSDYGVIDGLAGANSGAGTPINNTNYNVAADLNRDGVIDSGDTSLFTSMGGAKSALASGLISDSSGPDNPFGYDGYVYNPDQGLYTVRFRWYSPSFGRWLERDPLGLPAGMNANEYASGRPSYFDDPLGLYADDDDGGFMDSVIRWIIRKLGGEGSPELTRQFQEGIRQRRELANDADPIIKDAAEQCACDAENYQKAMGEVARQAAAQILTYPFGGDGIGSGIGSAKSLTESLIHLAESAPEMAGNIVFVFVRRNGNNEEVLGTVFQVIRNAKGEPVSPSTSWGSFDALKAALPKPPSECVYHHIVEQCQANAGRSGFPLNRINSVGNVVVVPKTINQDIANFYSSKPTFTGGRVLRDWLSGQTWEFQQQFGEQMLARAMCGTLGH
ncbi:MAG: RHS repeat-associated core domain-containing protein [Phycisphaerales bacterium]|nr:RHS repeat-associated core domain-containing protein [Phycisphaerales bacterium]